MKILKGLVSGVCAIGLVMSLSSVSSARIKQSKMHLGAVNSAATELQATRPDLAAGLTKYAEDKTREKLEKEAAKVEKEGAVQENEDEETEAQHEANIKLFKDSAAALQATQPGLATTLNQLVASEEKMLAEKKERKNK